MLAFIGGTGPEGLGLAVRFAHAGQSVIIGSRSAERGEEAAQKVRDVVPTADVRGAENAEAARAADIILVTVPYSGQRDTLTALEDAIGEKIVINTVVPLKFEGRRISTIPVPEGSAAQEAQAILPRARVAAAFHNVSAEKLMHVEAALELDVVVCSDNAEARQTAIDLANSIAGARGLNGGSLANSHFVEDLTGLLVILNRNYKTQSGVRFVGVSG